jgi:hypothetical protein
MELARKNLIVECSDLLQWLIVTCMKEEAAGGPAAAPATAATAGGAGDDDSDDPVVVPPPAPAAVAVPLMATKYFQRVPADAGLLREVMERVRRELPGLTAGNDRAGNGGSEASGLVSAAMVQALQAIAANQQRPVAVTTTAVVTPRSVFGSSVGNLLRILQCNEDRDLPQFWTDLARASKSQQISVITNKFAEVAERLKVAVPLVTKKVQDFFVQLRFQFTDRDNLMEGLSPFLFPPLNPMQRVATSGVYRNYADVVMAGTLTMREAEELEARDRKAVPVYTLTEIREMLAGFHVFIHTLLERNSEIHATQHDFLSNWDELWEEIDDNDRIWEEELLIKGRAFQIVRYVHLEASTWANQQVRVPYYHDVPKFIDMWQSVLKTKDDWVPRGGRGHEKPAGTSTGFPSAPGGNQTQKSGNKRKTLSFEDKVDNPEKISELLKLDPEGKLVREALAKGRRTKDLPPFTKHNPAVTYCFSWHLKGWCFKTCDRAADHVVHETADREAMVTWLKRNF